MMRSRTIREGSVGLLILVGLGLFGLLVLWLQGISFGDRSYQFTVEFNDVEGMQLGAPVRYRGVTVGEIKAIRPLPNAVEADLEIRSAKVLIPQNARIEANQSGFIGETGIDITPLSPVAADAIATTPIAPDCGSSLLVCDGDRLQGAIGVSFNELLRSTIELTQLIADEEFFGQVENLTRNSADAAASVTTLSREITGLTQSFERNLNALSNSANASTASVGRAADQIGLTASQVNNLITSNRSAIVNTLDNLDRASSEIQTLTGRLTPVVDRVEQGQFLQNLEVLSANAVEASSNLRDLSQSVGSTDNVLLLQQTLDSARATFENAQKITADLDELTGDPEFRRNIRDLVDGLSGLVSTTQQLQQQAELAQVLTPMAIGLQQAAPSDRPAAVPTAAPDPVAVELNPDVRLHPYQAAESE